MYQMVFEGVQLTEWLFLSLYKRLKSCRIKITLQDPFSRLHQGGLHSLTEANTASVACEAGMNCCFFEHQISNWLVFRGQLVWKICFVKHQNPTQLCDMFTLWEALWNEAGWRSYGIIFPSLLSLTLGREVIEQDGWCAHMSAWVSLPYSPIVGISEFFGAKACVMWHYSSCCDVEFLPI